MLGHFIDTIRVRFKKNPNSWSKNIQMMTTNFGAIRVLDTKGNKPVILSIPDGPNVIEHHEELIAKLSDDYRVVCFELPGMGFSYPNSTYDYSLPMATELIINLMDLLHIETATLAFSCSNGFYAIKAAESYPERVDRLFLSQTPSLNDMTGWMHNTIPKPLKYPIIGQIINAFSEKRLANIWYTFALPKTTDKKPFQHIAVNAIHKGGCFCLSSLVQGLSSEMSATLKVLETPATIIWGNKDYTHRDTDNQSIKMHLPNCEIIEFDDCGHFPDLEASDRYVELLRERMGS